MPCAGCSEKARPTSCAASRCRTCCSTVRVHRKPAEPRQRRTGVRQQPAQAGGAWTSMPRSPSSACSTRDGDSSYYINNSQVRRRDVRTFSWAPGLGARAYAIIGQGTISRIIESRPEELRVFLEEAAGVSKYRSAAAKPNAAARHARKSGAG